MTCQSPAYKIERAEYEIIRCVLKRKISIKLPDVNKIEITLYLAALSKHRRSSGYHGFISPLRALKTMTWCIFDEICLMMTSFIQVTQLILNRHDVNVLFC